MGRRSKGCKARNWGHTSKGGLEFSYYHMVSLEQALSTDNRGTPDDYKMRLKKKREKESERNRKTERDIGEIGLGGEERPEGQK